MLQDPHQLAALSQTDLKTFMEQDDDDRKVFEGIIHFYYQNQTVTDILLHNQEHPAVKQFMDELVEITTRQHMLIFEMIGKIYPRKKPLDPFAAHWLAHLQIESALGLVSHGFTEEEAIFHARSLLKIIRGGFFNLL